MEEQVSLKKKQTKNQVTKTQINNQDNFDNVLQVDMSILRTNIWRC